MNTCVTCETSPPARRAWRCALVSAAARGISFSFSFTESKSACSSDFAAARFVFVTARCLRSVAFLCVAGSALLFPSLGRAAMVLKKQIKKKSGITGGEQKTM
jgi:hypothetical protein